MFQKIYKHLEDINAGLRKDTTLQQLESINNSLVTQNKLLAAQQELSYSTHLQAKNGLTPILQVANLCIACVGIAVIIIFSFYTFRLSRVTTELVKHQVLAPVQPTRYVLAADHPAAGQPTTQSHLDKLDSLIAAEDRSITELKKLNTTATRTFVRMRKRLDQTSAGDRSAGLSDTPSLVR